MPLITNLNMLQHTLPLPTLAPILHHNSPTPPDVTAWGMIATGVRLVEQVLISSQVLQYWKQSSEC
jgi:hypothetical protein